MSPEISQPDQNNPQSPPSASLQPNYGPEVVNEASPIIQNPAVGNLGEVKKAKKPIGKLLIVVASILLIYLVHFAIQWNCTTGCESIGSYRGILYAYQALAPFIFFPILVIILYRVIRNIASR